MSNFSELLHTHWEAVLVMFAALFLVPKGLRILGLPQTYWYWLPATGLCAAYLLFPQPLAGLWALPYLLLAVWLTLREGLNLLVYKPFSLPELLRVFVLAYWATGAVWALCFLAQLQPLGFDPVIVALTAAHFHVAGFVLGTVIYALLRQLPNLFSRVLAGAALLGMPSVALGITLTRWGYTPWVEGFSSLLFAGMALAVVGVQISGFRQKSLPRAARGYWLGGAVCLLAGAVLAALYALRFQWPLPWINIPNLKVWHGTLNALGFGWLSLQGWQLVIGTNGQMSGGR
ncbi:MAG: YndJ family transporter [Saprospiraceae bacterium]